MNRRVGAALVLSLVAAVAGATTWGAQVNAATTPAQVRITAAGDFGEGTLTQQVFAGMKTRNPDLALALGDLSYGLTGSEQAWCDLVTARMGEGFPVELLAGNHESNGQNGNINDFAACLPNQLPGVVGSYARQYYVDVPREAPLVRFVMISPNIPFTDSTWSYAAGTARYAWTAAAIDGARAKGVPWVVVGMHKPCLSVGEYSCEPGADILNLLVAKKVDLVLTGHDHVYQRTAQLAHGATCPSIVPGSAANPACVADPDSSMKKGAGTVFATVATGGRALHQISATDPEAPYFLASSGANVNPTWGFLDFTVTASDLKASFVPTSGSFTDAFTIAAAPANSPPTAAFTAACTGLTCTVDGSGSRDADGALTAYQWSFGDGSTGTGATTTHAYGQAGTYTVTLTVTDAGGLTATTTRQVTPAAPVLATDDFTRTVTDGWGTATTGGAWTVKAAPGTFSVNGSVGSIALTAGKGGSALLSQISAASADLKVTVATDKAPTGKGVYAGLVGRSTAAGQYRAEARIQPTGGLGIALTRTDASGVETTLAPEVATAVTISPGVPVNLRVQVTGTAPTTIRAKAWMVGSPEPIAWAVTVTDSTLGLQGPRAIGVVPYLSASATNAPITLSIDGLVATAP